MNIYIYGDKSFKKEMKKVLSKDIITQKLEEIAQTDENFGKIIVIDKIDELKDIIKQRKNNIFLISNNRIITNNIVFNLLKQIKQLKFLKLDEYIDKKFLTNYEIAISVEQNDAISITEYVLQRLETYNINEITKIEEIREKDLVSALQQV